MKQPTGQKVCTSCKVATPLSEFHVNRAKRDGLMPICKPCARARTRAYKQANPERVAAAQRAYYYADVERSRAQARAYREAHRETRNAKQRARYAANAEYRERQRELVRAWIAAHPKEMAQHYHKKRARRAGVISGAVDMDSLWTGECGICGDPLDASLAFPNPLSKSIDHIVPLARGGTHTQDNVQWAHLGCNTAKGARIPG